MRSTASRRNRILEGGGVPVRCSGTKMQEVSSIGGSNKVLYGTWGLAIESS